MLERINQEIIELSTTVPLEFFAVVSSFLEEIIAPIPSPLIGTLLGSLAGASGYEVVSAVLWLGALAALGKTIACAVIYWAVARVGNAIVERFGPYIGVKHEDLIAVSSYFTGSMRDYFILILVRAVPFVPSLPISIAAGVFKTPLRFYLVSTFIGSWLRSMLFIFVGYVGISAYFEAVEDFANIESIVLLAVAALSIGLIFGLYLARGKKSKR